MTHNLDVVVLSKDGQAARERLREAGYRYQGELTIDESAWTAPDGTSVDLLEGRERWWAEAIAQAAANRDSQGLPVLPLSYLVLSKLMAGRV